MFSCVNIFRSTIRRHRVQKLGMLFLFSSFLSFPFFLVPISFSFLFSFFLQKSRDIDSVREMHITTFKDFLAVEEDGDNGVKAVKNELSS